ncbi:HAD family acid phosphatase [Bacillus sp. V5-8f]|uniref:5' nucleotidase, NT5C type n=1 Tax=Bacillus sp. V5-8f TaxID=2053044 RepID=UPI002155766D|nr:HAD family acid phosphatase [Bacillus sp. V5-8f]
MKFGFDIDDTLINLRQHAFHIYNNKLNQNVALDVFHALKRVEIHEAFGLSDEQGKEMWNSSLEEIYYTTCPLYPGAVEFLHELDEQGHEIYYITARPKEHGERTKKWLIENGFPVQEGRFFFGMKDEEKVKIIQNLDLDFYFDDKPAVLETLSNERAQLFVKDQSYNQNLGLPRFTNWSEITELVKKTVKKG